MTDKPTWEQIQKDRDTRVQLPLDPQAALDGLLQVDPDTPDAGQEVHDSDVTKGNVRGKTNT